MYEYLSTTGNTGLNYHTRALVSEIGENAARNRLVADDEYVLVSLEFHNDWLEARDQVLI